MNIIDLNILIYAVNENSPRHEKARTWLETQMNGTESIGLPWIVILGFLRIMTNGRIFPHPLTESQAVEIIDSWLSNPLVHIPSPKPTHWNLLKELVSECGTAGNLTSDVHLAAIAIEHAAKLYTLDADFSRFKGLRLQKPF